MKDLYPHIEDLENRFPKADGLVEDNESAANFHVAVF
jgi:hypothetical protein